jgi:hypothetical protein
MADAPPVKPWGQNDKDLLQKLINRGKMTSHAPVTQITSIESAISTSAHVTLSTFDATSEVTQDPVISRTT